MATTALPPAPAQALRLPDGLVLGPQRTGSTWIHRYLELRGDVDLPRNVKETWFFDRYYSRGLGWYAKQFDPGAVDRRMLEVSPGYFHRVEATTRIVRDLGRIPVACTLRDPADRTFSLWLHMRRYGMTRLSFGESLDAHPELLESGRYATHLERWRDTLGDENVLALRFEDLRDEPERCMRDLCRHFEIEFRPLPDSLRARVNESRVAGHHTIAWMGNKVAGTLRSFGMHSVVEGAKRLGLKRTFFGAAGTKPVPELASEDRRRVLDALGVEIERVEQLLDLDLSDWKR